MITIKILTFVVTLIVVFLFGVVFSPITLLIDWIKECKKEKEDKQSEGGQN